MTIDREKLEALHKAAGSNALLDAAIAKTRQRIENAVGNADPVKASLRPTEPAVDKIQAVAEGVANIVGAPYEDWRHFTGEAKAILARLETAAEPAGEQPKGWLYNGVWSATRLPDFMRGEMTETPLYARPAPSNQDRLVETARQMADALYKIDNALSGRVHSRDAIAALSAGQSAYDAYAALSAPALDGEKGE